MVNWPRRVAGGAVVVVVDVLLRLALREPLCVEREQNRHTLGLGAAKASCKDQLRPATDRRLSRGGMICRSRRGGVVVESREAEAAIRRDGACVP